MGKAWWGLLVRSFVPVEFVRLTNFWAVKFEDQVLNFALRARPRYAD
jgi:hypothetical protein